MKTNKRIIAGRQAKRRGEGFENLLHGEAYRKGWQVIRIPDGCKQVSAAKTIRVRTPFDFIFVKNNKAIFIDAKTTKAKSFSTSQLTPHQIKILSDLDKNGFQAGYIINFSELNITSFYRGSQLAYLLKNSSSLKPQDGVIVGTNTNINIETIFISEINIGPEKPL